MATLKAVRMTGVTLKAVRMTGYPQGRRYERERQSLVQVTYFGEDVAARREEGGASAAEERRQAPRRECGVSGAVTRDRKGG